MNDPFEFEEDEWVEICDASGKRSAMRHLATLSVSGKTYFVLGAVSQEEDGPDGLLLVREDETVDGVHATDLGFLKMAEGFEPVIRGILGL